MRLIGIGAFCATLLAVAAPPANAAIESRNVVVDLNGGELADLMHAFGYRAEIGTDSVGDPMVSSSTAGLNYSVLFYDCNDATPKACGSLQFWASFEVPDPLDRGTLDDWNRRSRYAKAYTAEDGAIVVEMDVELAGGVTQTNLRTLFSHWDGLLGDFARHIDW